MKNRCELCSRTAQIFCDSDQANLCYDCDRNIHSANFLVAKHSRTLLCHKCQSHTPWIASGVDLGRAASVCVNCFDENLSRRRLPEDEISHRRHDVVEESFVGETDDIDVECSDSDSDEDEDEENQVVPWSSVASSSTRASSSSTSERFSSGCSNSDLKRKRMDADLDSEDDSGCSSERLLGKARTETDDATSLIFFSNIKDE